MSILSSVGVKEDGFTSPAVDGKETVAGLSTALSYGSFNVSNPLFEILDLADLITGVIPHRHPEHARRPVHFARRISGIRPARHRSSRFVRSDSKLRKQRQTNRRQHCCKSGSHY